MKVRSCGSCGSSRRQSTALPVDREGRVPRVASTDLPTKFVVDGLTFTTLGAAQDYARSHPGSKILPL